MDGKVIFDGEASKKLPLIIRYLKNGDEILLCDFMNNISKEQTYIRFQGEEIPLDFERKYINDQLIKIQNHLIVKLLAFSGNALIGEADIIMKDRVESHVGTLGVLVAKDYRGKGVGKLLVQKILEEGKKELPQLRIAALEVYSINNLAIKIYEKFGFQKYGILPQGIKYKGEYVDEVFMYKKL